MLKLSDERLVAAIPGSPVDLGGMLKLSDERTGTNPNQRSNTDL